MAGHLPTSQNTRDRTHSLSFGAFHRPIHSWIPGYSGLRPAIMRAMALVCVVQLLSISTARGDYKKAVALFSQGKYAQALDAIKPDAKKNPDWEFGHRLMGLCYVQLGQNSLAVASLAKAIQLKSTSFSTYQGLSQAYYNLGKYDNAANILITGEKYAKTGADQYNLFHLRGSANLRRERYPEAISDLSSAIRLRRSSYLDFTELGAAYLGQKSYTEAINALEKALQMKPGHQPTREFLGRAYEMAGAESLRAKDFKKAVASLSKALEYKPADGSILYNLGSAYLLQDRFQEAEDPLVRASGLLENNAKVFKRLGYLYEMTRDLDRAINAYERAAQLDPSPDNKASVERIKKRKSRQPER